MVYLFIGQDRPAKEARLKQIKEEHLGKELESFNLDIIYAKGLKLKELQEKFLNLPVNSRRRLIVIRDASELNEESREFIARYSCAPHKHLILVIDFERFDPRDNFLKELSANAQTLRFKETLVNDTFGLGRQIASGKTAPALGILTELLKAGERPERILGGLRYVWAKQNIPLAQSKLQMRLLLDCDIEIKKGRLKPAFALEKLVVNLCAFGQPEH